MYEKFLEIYAAFKKFELEDPLAETLRYFDIMSNGSLEELNRCVSENSDIKADVVAKKRKERIPLEYILGISRFCGEQFYCSPASLIPRKETE